jgi:Ca-activated chloride channel family protein
MLNLINRLKNNKPLLFAIYGASGCLTAAILLGEPFLALTKLGKSSITKPQAIVLLIDTSSSMSDGKLAEVKTAASQFIQRRNLESDQIAVVNFGANVQTPAPLTNNINTLNNAIDQLLEIGSTPMGEGINTAQDQLQATTLNKNIILFTDGLPDDPNFAYNSALSVRNAGIKLIAVATGGADTNYLTQITGDRSLVFYANSGQFDQAFSQAEAVIYKQLIESNTGENYGFAYSIFRTGGWTAFLALGISLEQTKYLVGIKPISMGTGLNVEIPLNAVDGFTPLTARIFKEGGDIIMQFDQEYAMIKKMKVTSQTLKVGDVRKLGKITIEVKDKT